MRHRKGKNRLGLTTSHYRCRMANMVKVLLVHGRIQTTVTKAKHLRSHAEKVITIAKTKEPVTAARMVKSKLMLRYNTLTPKDKRNVKEGDLSSYNEDRKVLKRLNEWKEKYLERNGGYTRIIKMNHQVGDGANKCIIEFI